MQRLNDLRQEGGESAGGEIEISSPEAL